MKPYTPKPGSVAAKVVEHMLGQPLGTVFTSKEICEALDLQSSNLKNYIVPLISHDIVRAISDGTRSLSYELGQRVDPFDADAANGGKPQRRHVKAGSTPPVKTGPSSVFELGGPSPPSGFKGWLARKAEAETTPPQKRERRAIVAAPVRQEVTLQSTAELACAMFNTGDLLIEAPGQPILRLNSRQCADLIGYLQRFAKATAAV